MINDSDELDLELRFRFPNDAAKTLSSLMEAHTDPLIHDSRHPVAYSRTTYFDTKDLDLFRERRRTQVARRIRLREYAAAPDPSTPAQLTGLCFFELKTSAAEKRIKQRCQVTPKDAEAVLSGIRGVGGPELSAILGAAQSMAVRPWVTAWYRRTTRVSADSLVRLTLDENLVFGLPPVHCGAGKPGSLDKVISQVPGSLLEVKWKGEPPEWLGALFNTIAPHQTDASKFELAMQALLGASAA